MRRILLFFLMLGTSIASALTLDLDSRYFQKPILSLSPYRLFTFREIEKDTAQAINRIALDTLYKSDSFRFLNSQALTRPMDTRLIDVMIKDGKRHFEKELEHIRRYLIDFDWFGPQIQQALLSQSLILKLKEARPSHFSYGEIRDVTNYALVIARLERHANSQNSFLIQHHTQIRMFLSSVQLVADYYIKIPALCLVVVHEWRLRMEESRYWGWHSEASVLFEREVLETIERLKWIEAQDPTGLFHHRIVDFVEKKLGFHQLYRLFKRSLVGTFARKWLSLALLHGIQESPSILGLYEKNFEEDFNKGPYRHEFRLTMQKIRNFECQKSLERD